MNKVVLHIESSKRIFDCDPGDRLGSIFPSSIVPGGWCWCRVDLVDYTGGAGDNAFPSIDAALTDFCQNAFDEPVSL